MTEDEEEAERGGRGVGEGHRGDGGKEQAPSGPICPERAEPQARAPSSEAELQRWKRKDLWSEQELQDMCCGFLPDGSRPEWDDVCEATESIRRAVAIGALKLGWAPADAGEADEMYGHSRFFVPEAATAWACKHFPDRFPFKPSDFQKEEPSTRERDNTRERDTLLKIIIGMAIGGYGHPLNGNSDAPGRIADDLISAEIPPVSAETVRNKLREAAEKFAPKKSK